MAARQGTTTEWMLHPNSFVFKSFVDDTIVKQNFPQFSQSHHTTPEKIVESFVDPTGVRCYRVKWLDSWLSEQHISASFPHLITEYWINKPINDTDYQTFPGQSTRNASLNANTSSATSNNINETQQILTQNLTNDANMTVVQTEGGDLDNNKQETLLQAGGTASEKRLDAINGETTVTLSLGNLTSVGPNDVPQLFNAEEKAAVASALQEQNLTQNQQQQTQNQSNDNQELIQKESADFVVEDLRLPDRVSEIKVQKVSGRPESVFLIGKTQQVYNFETELKDRANKVNPEFQKAPPVSVFNHLQHFTNQPQQEQKQQQQQQQGIPLAVMQQLANTQVTQQLQHQNISLEIVRGIAEKRPHVEFQAVLEKKPSSRRASGKKDPKEKQPVACDICGKMISSRKNLRVHKTVRHFKNGSFSCDICGRKFALNRDLQRHMPLHTNERNYVCKFCGLQCKQPGHLTKHLRTHTEVMNWRCDCCFKNFKVQADLKEHCFTEHTDIKDKNLTCSVCKEKLKLPNSVYLHSLRHSGVREHECVECKATFKLKQHLQVHMRVHNKPTKEALEKSVCHICQRAFKSKAMLDKHISKHVELTAEEYETKRKLSAQEKRRSSKRVKQQQENNEQQTEESGDESDTGGESEKPVGVKRKRRKPSRIEYNSNRDDINADFMTARKRLGHSCTYCNETFASIALLNSHIKLHIRDKVVLSSSTPQQQPAIFKKSDTQQKIDGNQNTLDPINNENAASNSAPTQNSIETDSDNKIVTALLNQINNQIKIDSTSTGVKGLVLEVATEAGSLQITTLPVDGDSECESDGNSDNVEIDFPKDDESTNL